MSYRPTDVPTDVNQLADWLRREMMQVSQSFQAQQPFLQLQTMNAAPAKPREGMIVRADGTNWNPGSGSGFYGYRDAGWHLLG